MTQKRKMKKNCDSCRFLDFSCKEQKCWHRKGKALPKERYCDNWENRTIALSRDTFEKCEKNRGVI